MATQNEIDAVKKILAAYFDSQHKHVSNTRKNVKDDPCQHRLSGHLFIDDHQRITRHLGEVKMVSVLDKENEARKKLKDDLAAPLGFPHVRYFPGEISTTYPIPTAHPFPINAASMEHSRHAAILKKMGFALKEIEETKEYMHAFITVHKSKNIYLHSAWDMEMYKLQSAYVNLKKKVLSEN
jgi:hypothetical protein